MMLPFTSNQTIERTAGSLAIYVSRWLQPLHAHHAPPRPLSFILFSLDDMAGREEILKRWSFPHRDDHGVTLVAREDAPACIERIVSSGCRFYGYDSFIVRGETIQPVMEFSPDWSRSPVPSLPDILAQLASHPSEITDYEFVFEDAE